MKGQKNSGHNYILGSYIPTSITDPFLDIFWGGVYVGTTTKDSFLDSLLTRDEFLNLCSSLNNKPREGKDRHHCAEVGGFAKIKGTFWGVTTKRNIIFRGLFWGSPYLGKLPRKSLPM